MTYYEKAILILSCVVKYNKTLTKEQCKTISDCYKIISDEDVTKEMFCNIDNMLMNVDLDWFSPISDND
jgi:hypothetical protein